MLLPESRRKRGHTLESMIWILFNNKMWGREMERNTKERRDRGRLRQSPHVDPPASFWSFFPLGFSAVEGSQSCSKLFIMCTFLQAEKLMLIGYTGVFFYWLNDPLASNANQSAMSLFFRVNGFLELWSVVMFSSCQNYFLPSPSWLQQRCWVGFPCGP